MKLNPTSLEAEMESSKLLHSTSVYELALDSNICSLSTVSNIGPRCIACGVPSGPFFETLERRSQLWCKCNIAASCMSARLTRWGTCCFIKPRGKLNLNFRSCQAELFSSVVQNSTARSHVSEFARWVSSAKCLDARLRRALTLLLAPRSILRATKQIMGNLCDTKALKAQSRMESNSQYRPALKQDRLRLSTGGTITTALSWMERLGDTLEISLAT